MESFIHIWHFKLQQHKTGIIDTSVRVVSLLLAQELRFVLLFLGFFIYLIQLNYFRHKLKAQLIFQGSPKMISYFCLPTIVLKHVRASKITEINFFLKKWIFPYISWDWQLFYLWFITFPITHSTVFSHFSQRTLHIFRHSLSVKEMLEMPQNM